MQPVLERLGQLAFFQSLSAETAAAVAAIGSWHSVAGGWSLFEQGSEPQRLYFVLSGRLIVVRSSENDDNVVGYVRTGEPVGEMSMIAGERHSASVYALRDSEVLSIERRDFETLMGRHADLAALLARFALARARDVDPGQRRSAPRVFAVVASSPSIDIDAYGARLAAAVRRLGLKAVFQPVSDEAPDSRLFDAEEERVDALIIAARVEDSGWYRFVLRHSDRFLVFARRDARPPRPFPMVTQTGLRARQFRLVDLVMLHEGAPTGVTADWIDILGATRIFHLRRESDLRRIARVVAGRSVGLVLSGGGARAYAHVGAVRALRERAVELDFLCGASMGAIIAACVAMGWDHDEIDERLRDAFVSSNPLGDHVLPVVALTRGLRVEERLKRHFGDALIEELETPFFCVSSELTQGRLHIHRTGLLRDALRATISLPGILPPVVRNGALLVDGAVVNNFPSDLMATTHRGLTIGVDVARQGTIDPAAFVNPPGFFSWVRRNGVNAAPPVVSLLMRSATARRQEVRNAHPADIMVTPDVAGVELRDWKKYDRAVADGYRATCETLDGHEDLLASLCATEDYLHTAR